MQRSMRAAVRIFMQVTPGGGGSFSKKGPLPRTPFSPKTFQRAWKPREENLSRLPGMFKAGKKAGNVGVRPRPGR